MTEVAMTTATQFRKYVRQLPAMIAEREKRRQTIGDDDFPTGPWLPHLYTPDRRHLSVFYNVVSATGVDTIVLDSPAGLDTTEIMNFLTACWYSRVSYREAGIALLRIADPRYQIDEAWLRRAFAPKPTTAKWREVVAKIVALPAPLAKPGTGIA